MARLFVTAAAFAVAAGLTNAAVVDLPEGEFYRPSGTEVSGVVGATTTYTRSPCPALNSMANHGYIPRDGKNLTRASVQAAIMKTFNLEETLANSMASQAPNVTFSLADLSEHNVIEHDVSFARADAYFGGEPSQTTPAYLNELLALSKPTLTLEKTAWLRAERLAECKAKNPKCDYTKKFTADFQSGLLLRVLGGKNKEEISYEFVESFFEKERFPADYVKITPAVQMSDILGTITALDAVDTTKLKYDLPAGSTAGSSSAEVTPSVNSTTSAPTSTPASSVSSTSTVVAVGLVSAAAAWML